MQPREEVERNTEKYNNNDLPAVKLHKINARFEKHLTAKLNKIEDLVRYFITTDHQMKQYRKEGVNNHQYKIVKNFFRFLKNNLVESQVPNLRFLGAVSTALRFTEIEILTWCFGVY